MTQRKYPKGAARAEEILEVALRVVSERGYNRATVRQLADAAGLSATGLLHHFGTKEALFAEILRRRDAVDATRATATDGEGAEAHLSDLPGIAVSDPGLVQLYTRFSAEATAPEHAAHAFFRERYERSRTHLAEVLTRYRAEGRLAPDADPDLLATALIAALDGLQVQWLFDDEVPVQAAFTALLMALGTAPRPTP